MYGDNYIEGSMKLQCVIGETKMNIDNVWKADGKLGFIIPNMGDTIEAGDHPCAVELSVNGQQYSHCGKTFLYMSTGGMSEEELKKLEEEEAKAAGKKGKKK